MKTHEKLIILLSLITSLFATENTGIESLSPELRALLSQEMIALEKGMKSIFSNIISGDYEEMEITAEQIQNILYLNKVSVYPSVKSYKQNSLSLSSI